MKKRNLFLIVALMIILSINSSIYAHKEWVHQYIVKESYKFLEQELGDIPELKYYLGMDQYGYDDEWYSSNAIAIGAWAEDHLDILYLYGSHLYSFRGWDPSITHFWLADDGDNEMHYVFATGPVQNAWTKAQQLIFGMQYDEDFSYCPQYNTDICESGIWYRRVYPFLQYRDLCNFLTTKQFRYKKFYDINGREKIFNNSSWITLSNKVFPYTIVGRIAHLLADMSVPAHSHNDYHPCGILGDGDYYELWISSNDQGDCNEPHTSFRANGKDGAGKYGTGWNALTAREQGGLLYEVFSLSDYDAVNYLFYSLNQLSEHFPSYDSHGNKDADGNNLLNIYTDPLVLGWYQTLGDPPSSFPLMNDIANATFNYAIRATSTLFYWLAVKTSLVECPTNLYLQNNIYYGNRGNSIASFKAASRIYAGKNIRSDIPQGLVINKTQSKSEYIASNEIALKDGFISENGSESVFKISGPCQLSSNQCIANGPGNIVESNKINNYPEITVLDDFKDTLLSISAFFWQDAVFEGDTINYLKCSNLIYDKSNPAWSGDSSEISYPQKKYYTDTVNIYFVDTLTFDERFVTRLIGNYSYSIGSDTNSTYAIIINENNTQSIPNHSNRNIFNLSIEPNISAIDITVNYILEESTSISILLCNSNGQVVSTIVKDELKKKGKYSINYNVSSLFPGLYYIAIFDKRDIVAKKFIIVR